MRLAEAVARELFGHENAGQPVYALANETSLSRIATAAGLGSLHPIEEVVDVVRESLGLDDSGVAPFHWQAEAVESHRRQPRETPASLPLLVLLTTAAEQMQADGNVAAHNYYSRLHRLLRVPQERRARVESNYRKHAIDLWGSLNEWLESWEGERGIPTAYSVGRHEFIGLPLSQAVVRQHDRDGLHELFALEAFAPGSRVSPSDMEIALEQYVTNSAGPLSAHLRALWKAAASRERIVDASCLELEVWDGAGHEGSTTTSVRANARLLAHLSSIPRRAVVFGLVLPRGTGDADAASFRVGDSDVVASAEGGPGGSIRILETEGISSTSLVEEVLEGTVVGEDRRDFSRKPRRVVPLCWDYLQGGFVECEQLALGEEGIVLARTDSRTRVEAHLLAHARPGWAQDSDLVGVPDGWVLYERVQIVSAPNVGRDADLIPLIPRARTSLTFRGGFALPGLLRKWSSLRPPEIVALASGAASVAVRVYRGSRVDAERQVICEERDEGFAAVPLADRELADGEYFVAMFVDGSDRPSSAALLRLRSADTPHVPIEDVDMRLVYSADASAMWPLSAGPAVGRRYVNGARVAGLTKPSSQRQRSIPEFTPRRRPTATPALAPLRVGTAALHQSCLLTGKHRFQLATVLPDQPRKSSVEGECETCGLVRRFAATPWAARRKSANPTDPSHVVPIVPLGESGGADLRIAVDALCHVGHGNFAVFERITAQAEQTGVLADSFLRRQEVLGHLDVARDHDLRVTEWAINSPSLVPISSNRWVLVGARSRRLVNLLKQLLDAAEVVESIDAGLPVVEVVGALGDEARLLGAGITVLEYSCASEIANALPTLGEVASGLKTIAVPGYLSAEHWDSARASWLPATSLGTPGAYRLRQFRTIYILRSEEDIDAGAARIGNAQLVKHVANLWSSDPLLGYHSRSSSVVVPLGADLPGLFGRALSLCSGRAPRELVEHRMLQYPAVPVEVADLVYAKLTT